MDKSIFVRYCKQAVKLHIAPQTRFGAGGGGGAEGGVRGGCSLIWPQRECAAAQGMIFRVLGLKQDIQFFYLMSWNECLFGPKAFKRVGRLAMSNEQSLLFSPVGTCCCTGCDFQPRDTISLSDILKWVGFFAPGVVQKVGNERFTCVVPSIFTKNFNTWCKFEMFSIKFCLQNKIYQGHKIWSSL